MDIQLPGMNGIDAPEILPSAAGTAAIPVLAVTASVMLDDRKLIVEAGFDADVVKANSQREYIDAWRLASGVGAHTEGNVNRQRNRTLLPATPTSCRRYPWHIAGAARKFTWRVAGNGNTMGDNHRRTRAAARHHGRTPCHLSSMRLGRS